MTDEPEPVRTTETITLTQVILGLNPYVLIECEDGPGEGVELKIRAGGIPVADQIGYLPLLMLQELPLDSNPVSQELNKMIRDVQENPNGKLSLTTDEQRGAAIATIRMVAHQLGFKLDA